MNIIFQVKFSLYCFKSCYRKLMIPFLIFKAPGYPFREAIRFERLCKESIYFMLYNIEQTGCSESYYRAAQAMASVAVCPNTSWIDGTTITSAAE